MPKKKEPLRVKPPKVKHEWGSLRPKTFKTITDERKQMKHRKEERMRTNAEKSRLTNKVGWMKWNALISKDLSQFSPDFQVSAYIQSLNIPDWQSLRDSQQKALKPRRLKGTSEICARIYGQLTALYEKEMAKDQDARFSRTMAMDGTKADQVASLSLLLLEAPVFHVHTLHQTVLMLESVNRSHKVQLVDGLREFFLEKVLISERPLASLTNQEFPSNFVALYKLSEPLDTYRWATFAFVSHFEHCVKKEFGTFLGYLFEMMYDSVELLKMKAIKLLCEFLCRHSEQEAAILQQIVLKFGDPVDQVASKTAYFLKNVLKIHPKMKLVVAEKVSEHLANWEATNEVGTATGLKFLCEMELGPTTGEVPLASFLLNTYTQRLNAIVQKDQWFSSKKARFTEKNKELRQIDQEIRDQQVTASAAGHEIPKLGAQKRKLTKEIERRYSRLGGIQEEDSVAVCSLLGAISRVYPFLLTLQKGTKLMRTPEENETLLEVLFKFTHMAPNPKTQIEVFHLIYTCFVVPHPHLEARWLRALYAELSTGNLLLATNRPTLLADLREALLNSSVKTTRRAICRRLLQSSLFSSPEIGVPMTVWTLQLARDTKSCAMNLDAKMGEYDPSGRCPEYAERQTNPLWELISASHHVHPFVAQSAVKLMRSNSFAYPGSPFEDFRPQELLDRFAYADPKPTGYFAQLPPVNANPQSTDAPVHEVFFQKYFNEHAPSKKQKKAKISEEDFFDQAIEEEMIKSMGRAAYNSLVG